MNRRDRLLNNRSFIASKEKDRTFHHSKRQSYRGIGTHHSKLRKETDIRSSIRRKSGSFMSIPLALKRKKSLNELFTK